MDECANWLGDFKAAVRRARWRLAAWPLFFGAAALAYAWSEPAQYVARVSIEIAPKTIANDGPEDVRHIHQLGLDSEQAATELEVLRSERLLRPVFESLNLQNSPELLRSSWLSIGRIVQWVRGEPGFGGGAAPFFAFADRVRCLRLGLSYVFEVDYRSHDPELAARVANAISAQYLADRINRENDWLARIGGAYQASRQQSLHQQLQQGLAAARDGLAPPDNLFAANARVLSAATPPLGKSFPRFAPVMAMGAGVGLLFGLLNLMIAAMSQVGSVRASVSR